MSHESRLDDALQTLRVAKNTGASVRQAHHSGIEAEILGETAAASGRAGERLTAAWQALTKADASNYAGCLQAYRAARWEVQVHREAMGLRDHRIVDEIWPIPPAP